MITVETRPERMTAVQWHQPGDALEVGIQSYRIGTEERYGMPAMSGMQRVRPGDWIVFGAIGEARVYANGEFHQKFKIIEEGSHE